MSSARSGSNVEAVIADVLADLANASINLDPAARARLAILEGYRIQINALFPAPLGERAFGLTVTSSRLRLHARDLDAPNVVVSGPPADLVRWLATGQTPAHSRISIDGDGTVLQELLGVLRGYRPDLGAPLGRLVGEDAANRLLGTAGLALASFRSALEGAGNSVREGASQAFADGAQAERLLDELDDLRLRVDRLQARVDAEERRRQPS